MPLLSRIFMRVSLFLFLTGFTIGAIRLINKANLWILNSTLLATLHSEILISGWLINFIWSTAYWIFPRVKRGIRGREFFAWFAFICYNLSLLIIWLCQIAFPEEANELNRLAYIIIFLSVLSFLFHLWPRIRKIIHNKT